MKEKFLLVIILIAGFSFTNNNCFGCYQPPIYDPTAIFTAYPEVVSVGEGIFFDGRQSTPGSGQIQYWDWNFDYGNVWWYPGGSTITHYYTATGFYKVALLIQNTYSRSSMAFRDVEVRNILYVDKNATGNNSGSTWENAFNNLQDALTNAVAGYEIWVAEGVYRPDENHDFPDGTGLRTDSFDIQTGVKLYGGFPTHGCWKDRDPKTYETILSGDIGTEGVNNDNSYNIISIWSDNVVIDGFTITKGYAGDPFYGNISAGISNYNTPQKLGAK